MSKFAEHNPIQPLKKKIVFEVLTDDNLTTTNKLSKYYQVLTAYFFECVYDLFLTLLWNNVVHYQ